MLKGKFRSFAEAELEKAVVDLFSGAGSSVRRQVPCRFGRADVVTNNAIIELKDTLSRRSLYQAVGQLTLYRPQLNPSAKMVIVCLKSKVRPLHEWAGEAGIEVFEWAEFKCTVNLVSYDPPYSS